MSYDFNDWWTTSPAENLRNQYRSLVAYLDRNMQSLESDFTEVQRTMLDGLSALTDSLEGCEGITRERLLENVILCKEEINAIFVNYENAIEDLRAKHTYAAQKLDDYQWYVDNEDAREKQYSYSEIG